MTTTREEALRKRAHYLTGLVWHAGSFLVLSVFFVVLDLWVGPGGIQWAWWIILFWAMALAFHGLAYLIDGRQLEERVTQRWLAEDERRESHGREARGLLSNASRGARVRLEGHPAVEPPGRDGDEGGG